jgi:predicted dehydrogenase
VADFGHIPAILETPGLELAAIFDPSQERLGYISDKFGLTSAFTGRAEFFDQKLDAVVIASPPSSHLENAVEAARSGAHVLCEKPLARTEEESRLMAEEVERTGRMLFTAFVYRFSPVAAQIKQWLREGVVGKIGSLRLIYDWSLHGRYEQDSSGNWIESTRWRGRMEEGGPLIDCGVHLIDLARWWLESEVVAQSSAGAWLTDYDSPDHVYLHMQHANGALTTVETSFSYTHTAREPLALFSYQLVGDGGLIRFERDGYILEARHGQGTIHTPGASEKNFHGMYLALRSALETGAKGDLGSAEDGIIATRIATSATQSAIEQRALLATKHKSGTQKGK